MQDVTNSASRAAEQAQRDDVDELIRRPRPETPIADRVRLWVGWIGLGRTIASAVSVVIVCVGGYWLVRSPAPTAESLVPATEATPVSDATLPLPVIPDVTDSADPADASPATVVVVHIAGAVEVPGVYEMSAGERIDDLVRRSGGADAEADLDSVNLAAVLVDGARVYIPTVGEVDAGSFIAQTPDPASSSDAAGSVTPAGPVDVNRAAVAELDGLPGVGPATAAAIVTERERNGPFLGVDDLERVPGIGPAKLTQIRDLVTV